MWTRSSRIWCDQEGCHETQPIANVWVVPAFAEARRLGWTMRSGFHFCPEHSPAPDSDYRDSE